MKPDKSLWAPEQGLSREKNPHLGTAFEPSTGTVKESGSLSQKFSAKTFLHSEKTLVSLPGFTPCTGQTLEGDKTPPSFWENPHLPALCLQLPCLVMLCAPCCWWCLGTCPRGEQPAPKLPTDLSPWLQAQRGHYVQISRQGEGEHRSPPSHLLGQASCRQGWSKGEQKAGVCKVASSCHHWHLSNEVTTLGTGTISKVDITLKKC